MPRWVRRPLSFCTPGLRALTGALAGEFGDLNVAEFSLLSVGRRPRLAYLAVFGSWLPFTTYTWMLQNAPVFRVARHA